MLRRTPGSTSIPTLNLTRTYATKQTVRNFTILTAGKGADARKANITSNTSKKDAALHSRINIYKKSDYEFKKLDKDLLKYTKLKALTKNKNQATTYTPPSKETTAKWNSFLEKYIPGKKIKGEPPMMKIGGEHYPKVLVHTAMNRVDAQDMMSQLGKEIRKKGFTADDLPPFAPMALYGGREQMFIANTHGLRESDVAEMKALAGEQIDDHARKHEGCTFVFRVLYLDVRIESNHPTLGGTVSKDAQKSPIGQAHHIQTQFGYYDKDENFTPLYTQESTGSANHPTGKNAEFPSFSYNGDHKNAPTHNYPVRDASKNGEIDLRPVSTYMSEIQGQNTNLFYAVGGDGAQQPPGLIYEPKYYADVKLSNEAAKEMLSQVLLAEKGGQIILSDEMVPNTNKKYAESHPQVHEVISAGSFGQHGQSGGLLMCASTALDQAFGQTGIAYHDEGRPFLHEYQKPETTYDVFTNITLYAMSSDNKNAVLRGSDGKVISPSDYRAVLGEGTVENYRKTIVEQREKLQVGGVMDLGKESDDVVMVNGAGVTIPVNLRAPSTSISADNMTPFLAFGRELHSRYTPSQQAKDFGRSIGAGTPMMPEEHDALTAYARQMGSIYGLSEVAVQACIAKLPAQPNTLNIPGLTLNEESL